MHFRRGYIRLSPTGTLNTSFFRPLPPIQCFFFFRFVSTTHSYTYHAHQYEGMSTEYEEVLDRANLFFTIFFTIEAVLKLFAYNPTAYFNDSWNMLDFIIVVGSLVDIGLAGKGVSVSFLRLFRVARFVHAACTFCSYLWHRLLKIISKGQNMKRLLWTFLQSFKALPWVGLLIVLLFFMYAVIGMQLLGRVELSDDREINRHANFRTFPRVHSSLLQQAY